MTICGVSVSDEKVFIDFSQAQSCDFVMKNFSGMGTQGGILSEPSLVLGSSGNEVDFVLAGSVFTFFFSVTVGLWFLAKNLGVILQAIRRF